MKIGIVTVYESIDNFGSYLQAYALKKYLELQGHTVFVIQNRPVSATLKKNLLKLNPKREFFLRFKKARLFLSDNKRLNILDRKDVDSRHLDLLIYGSDEIWNLENPYFCDPFFWGSLYPEIPKIAFAVSVGAMEPETERMRTSFFEDLHSFLCIMVRDEKTFDFVKRRIGKTPPIVCDPTMLLPVSSLSEPIYAPEKPFLLVYTYGVDTPLAGFIKQYADKKDLQIVSACFWHPWADKTIECSPLQLSSLMQTAACVFTTTFHGALFSMLNHTKCCIYPAREKVSNIVCKLGMGDRLIDETCSFEKFESIIQSDFQTQIFEEKLEAWRDYSKRELEGIF